MNLRLLTFVKDEKGFMERKLVVNVFQVSRMSGQDPKLGLKCW